MLSDLNAATCRSAAASRPMSYRGPERCGTGDAVARWVMTRVLDEIDYGVLLLDMVKHVTHTNHVARVEMDAAHPLCVDGRELHARYPRDQEPLQEALHLAARRGQRRLLALGEGEYRASVSVVPLSGAMDAGLAALPGLAAATLVLLGKRQVCGALSVQGYARAHHLSPVEEQVLQGLCEGDTPMEIAERHGVKISTVRTQITHIRIKTGAGTIRDLVQRMARLPPTVGALRGGEMKPWMPHATPPPAA